MTAVEEQLRAEVEALREKLAVLVGGDDQFTQIRTSLGLRPKHAMLLALLFNTQRALTAEAIYANVFEHANGDGPILDCVKVAICQTRARMVALGAPERCIPAAFGTGSYTLTPEARAWLTERLQPMGIAA